MGFLTGLLGSTGFGAILGLAGGIVNRILDIKAKKVDHAHELALLQAQTEQLKMEWESRAQVASIEGAAKVEAAGYDAMAASYGADKATYGIKWVDALRGIVRPVLTLAFLVIAVWINAKILASLYAETVELGAIVPQVIDWMLFEASVVIGWWFATRPGRSQVQNRP